MRALLAAEPGLAVIWDGPDPGAALAALAARPADVVVADLARPRVGEFVRDVRLYCPGCRVVAFVADDHPGVAAAYRRAGASACVAHIQPAAELIAAIRAATADNVSTEPPEPPVRSAGDPLSPAERRVFLLIGQGLSNRDVAAALGQSVKTVETYRSRIKKKLGAANATQLAQMAVRGEPTNGGEAGGIP